MDREYIIAHADKTVLKISGLKIKGMNTQQLEQILQEKLHAFVRVIGVTGERLEMDVYNVSPEQIQRDENGLIQAVALADGISLTDLSQIVYNERIVPVDYQSIPDEPVSDCPMERWLKLK